MATTRRSGEPIRVFLRARPFNKLEEQSGCNNVLKYLEEKRVLIQDNNFGDNDFELDSVFDLNCNQEDVYRGTCANVPQQLLSGIDCAIITYGASETGKTYSLIGREATSRETEYGSAQLEEGIIPRLARDLFDAMTSSASCIEYTVRCSVTEIYLDRIRDLLIDSYHVCLVDGKLKGCSRLSCLSPEDVISIVYRGHAARTRSAVHSNRTSTRSSMIVQIEIEQYDSRIQSSKYSTLLLCDPVANALSSASFSDTVNETKLSTTNVALMSESLNALKRLVEERKNGLPVQIPPSAPPLALLLSSYFGGSSHTYVLLTVSVSHVSYKETIETLKFGETCRSITNTPVPNVHERWQDCSSQLIEARESNDRLADLVRVLASEIHRLQSRLGVRLSSTTLEKMISDITEATIENRELKFTIETKAEHQIRTEQMKLRSEARRAIQARDEILNSFTQMQTDLQMLNDQNIRLLEGKETVEAELARTKNELLIVQAETREAEKNLRTSQFRENEAVVFLRQFRRFYFRLRKKMAVDGSGNISQIVQQIPGAPCLKNLVDIDKRMAESGLLEQHEIGKDVSLHTKTSPEAILRSSDAACNMFAAIKEDDAFLDSSEVLHRKIPIATSTVFRENPQVIEARQRRYRSPAGKYLDQRENVLESELLSLSEKVSELEKELVEEREKVDTLTRNTGFAAALERLKHVKETKVMKDKLERKEHDLNAVIWKMNEMHVTGMSLEEMLLDRDNRIIYLENGLNDVQNELNAIVLEKERVESKLRGEVADLLVQIRQCEKPIRYFGDPSTVDIPFQCRLISPFTTDNTEKQQVRRASIGEAGEWFQNTNLGRKTEVQTQTHTETSDGEAQTELKELKDSESQTELRFSDQFALVDVKTQTDDIVTTQTHRRLDVNDAITQTDGVLLTLKDIELSTIEAATSSVPEATVEDLLFVIDSGERNFENTPLQSATKEEYESAAIQGKDSPGKYMSADAILPMKDEKQELSNVKIPRCRNNLPRRDPTRIDLPDVSSLDTDVALDSSEIMADASHYHNSALSSTEPTPNPTKGEEGDRSATLEFQSEHGNACETLGTNECNLIQPKKSSITESLDEVTTSKPVSKFLARLQAQARKKEAAQANEALDEKTVPEFLKKFKTIGARNANESVIESSGESTALYGEALRQSNHLGTRFVDTSSSIPWHPRRKSDDDSESNESGASIEENKVKPNAIVGIHDIMGCNAVPEVITENPLTTIAFEVNNENIATRGMKQERRLSNLEPEFRCNDDGDNDEENLILEGVEVCPKIASISDSSSDTDDEGKTPATTKLDDGIDSSKTSTLDSMPSPSNLDDKRDSMVDEEHSEDNECNTKAALLSGASKIDGDSISSTDKDEDENEAEAILPVTVALKANDKSETSSENYTSSDDDDSEEERETLFIIKGGEKVDDENDEGTTNKEDTVPRQVLSPPSISSSSSSSSPTENDSDSSSYEDQEAEDKATTAVALKADDGYEEESQPIAPEPTSSSKTIDDDSTDDSSDEFDEESIQVTQVSKPAVLSTIDDDGDIHSDEENEFGRKSITSAIGPQLVAPSKASDAGDSSSNDETSDDDQDDENDVDTLLPPRPSIIAPDIDLHRDSNDEDEEENQSTFQEATKTPKAIEESSSSSEDESVHNGMMKSEPAAVKGTVDDSERSKSDDSSEQLSETESTHEDPKRLLQGGKSMDFKPRRKVTDFGATLSPALVPKKSVDSKGNVNKISKSKATAKEKLVIKSGKLSKGHAIEELRGPTKTVNIEGSKKSSKFAVRGSDIVLDDDGEWGKSASKKMSKGKSSFVIKNGKLVKNESSSPHPAKMDKPAFKIIGGKLVKQGKSEGETKKVTKKKVSSKKKE